MANSCPFKDNLSVQSVSLLTRFCWHKLIRKLNFLITLGKFKLMPPRCVCICRILFSSHKFGHPLINHIVSTPNKANQIHQSNKEHRHRDRFFSAYITIQRNENMSHQFSKLQFWTSVGFRRFDINDLEPVWVSCTDVHKFDVPCFTTNHHKLSTKFCEECRNWCWVKVINPSMFPGWRGFHPGDY